MSVSEKETLQSEEALPSASTTSALSAPLIGRLPSFRMTIDWVAPSSLATLRNGRMLSSATVMLANCDGKTATSTRTEELTSRPLFPPVTVIRRSKLCESAAAFGGGINPNRTVFSSRGSR